MIRIASSFFLCFFFALHALAGTTGSVRGVVTDRDKKEPLGGVTVVATSPSLQGEIAALSDEQGLYTISDLPPGTYTITADFSGARSELKGVVVQIDKTVAVNLSISLTAAVGETYTIEEKAPNVDVATSTVGTTLTKDFIANVPMGRQRDISSALSASPTAGTDQYGVSVGGATSPENAYVIDGLNVTGPSHALLDTRLVLEFIEEFQIKEGGYGPEFGRSTGGFVNVVTKGGSNEFHGSVFAFYRPSWLQAAVKEVRNPESIFGFRTDLDYYLSTGFEIGGPIVKDLLWFHVGYSPELQSNNRVRSFQWWKGTTGGAPELGSDGQPIFESSGQFAAFPEQKFNAFTQTHQYTFKLTHLINNNNRHSLAVKGAPTFFKGAGVGVNGDPSVFNFSQAWSQNIWAGIYNYAGKYFNDKLKLDAVIGIHHQENHTTPLESKGNQPRITFGGRENFSDLADDPASVPPACNPANDFAPNADNGNRISRCPVTNYRKGGLGFLADENLSRLVEKLAFTSLFEFAGLHQLRYGIDFEQILSDLTRSYTGRGTFNSNQTGNAGAGSFSGQQFAINGQVVDSVNALTATLNYGVFIGDSWSPIPSLILNYGVRWELQDIMGISGPSPEERRVLIHKFTIPDNIAPRAGLVWDFTGKGKGALRFNYGRFYESVPLDLNERGFGGESLRITGLNRGTANGVDRPPCLPSGYNKETRQPNVAGETPLQYFQVTNPDTQCLLRQPASVRDVFLAGADSLVMPGLKGQYSDELILSFDYEAFPTWIFGVTGIYRYLGSVIEDMSTDGGTTYLMANPGTFDISQMDKLRDQLNQTTDPKERERLKSILAVAPAINTFPKATRDTWQVQFKVDKKLSDNFLLGATYVLSWVKGNYPGLFSTNNGQLDPNITSQFDLPQLLLNRDGYLPQDTRHRFKLGGYYKASLKEYGICAPFSFTLGASAYLQSGTPYEVLGRDELYGVDEMFILPRGTGGRTPWTWNVDLSLGAQYDFSDDISLELFAQVFNVFNTREVVTVDNRYTLSFVRPIVGGTKDQLAHARDTGGAPVLVNPNYGNATSYQAPLSGQLGARLKF